MDRPSLWELECFVAVAEELHFSKAAKRLHISQPPLSRQIQALERKLGVQLLRRKTRTVELTLPGELFLADAREILNHLDRASFAANRSGGGEIERLRLGFLSSLLGPDLIEVGEHFKTGAMRPSSEFPTPVHFAFPDTSERRSPGVGY